MRDENKVYSSVDAAILQPLIQNHLNTDLQIVANSVATALLALAPQNHFGATIDDALLNRAWRQCVNELECVKTKYPEYKVGIDYIIAKAEEPCGGHDVVTLYLPIEKASVLLGKPASTLGSAPYTDAQFFVPIRVVLPIVWRALQDNVHYLHHYSGTTQEKLAAAEKDREMRLSTFFNMLESLTEKNVCHQGVRHELVFTLNQVHDQVDVIEDARATIMTFVRDTMRQDFFAAYRYARDEKKRSLFQGLLLWMQGEAEPLLEILGKQAFYLDALKKIFITHASNPAVNPLSDMLAQAFSFNSFACSPQENILFYQVNHILNAPELSEEPARKNAIALVTAWLQDKFDPDNTHHIADITIFHAILNKHADLSKLFSLIIMSGCLSQEKCVQLREICDSYFLSIIDKIENMSLSPKQLEPFIELSKAVQIVKAHSFFNEIANYFTLFFTTQFEDRRRLYQLLFNPEFTKKVLWESHLELEKFLASTVINNSNERKITPYEINRAFLHALLVKPENWFPKFADYLLVILDFVSNCFNEPKIGLSKRLLEDSYHPALLEHIKDIIAHYQVQQDPALLAAGRVRTYFFLPDNIHKFQHLKYLKYYLTKKQLLDAYRIHHQNYFNIMLQACNSQTEMDRPSWVLEYLQHVPDEFKSRFVANFDVESLVIPAIAGQNKTVISTILLYLQDKNKLDVLNLTLPNGDSLLHHAFRNKNPDVHKTIIDFLPSQQSKQTLCGRENQHNETPLHQAINSGHVDAVKVIVSVFATDALKIAEFGKVTSRNQNAFELVLMSDDPQRAKILSLLLNGFPNDTGKLYILKEFDCEMPNHSVFEKIVRQHKPDLLYAAINCLQLDVNRSYFLDKIHKTLPLEQLLSLYKILDYHTTLIAFESLKKSWDNYLTNLNHLSELINTLNREQLTKFLTFFNLRISIMVQDPTAFRLLARNLHPKKVFLVYSSIERRLMIKNFMNDEELHSLVLFMTPQESRMVFSKVKNHLPMYPTPDEDFELMIHHAHAITNYISSLQRPPEAPGAIHFYLKSMDDVFTDKNLAKLKAGDVNFYFQLPRVLRNHTDLRRVITGPLNDDEYKLFLKLFAYHLPFIISNAEEYAAANKELSILNSERLCRAYRETDFFWYSDINYIALRLRCSNQNQRQGIYVTTRSFVEKELCSSIEIFKTLFCDQLYYEISCELFAEIQGKLPLMIKSFSDFVSVCNSKSEFTLMFIDKCMDILPMLITSISEFYSLRHYLSENQILTLYYSDKPLFARLTHTYEDIIHMGILLNEVIVFKQYCIAVRNKVVAVLPELLNMTAFIDKQENLRLQMLFEEFHSDIQLIISGCINIKELSRYATEKFFPDIIVKYAKQRLLTLVNPIVKLTVDTEHVKSDEILYGICETQFRMQITNAGLFCTLSLNHPKTAVFYLLKFPHLLNALVSNKDELNLLLLNLEPANCIKFLQYLTKVHIQKFKVQNTDAELAYIGSLLNQIAPEKRKRILSAALFLPNVDGFSLLHYFERKYKKLYEQSWIPTLFKTNLLKPGVIITEREVVANAINEPNSFTALALHEMVLSQYYRDTPSP